MRTLLSFVAFLILFGTVNAQKIVETSESKNSPELSYRKALEAKDANDRLELLSAMLKKYPKYAKAYYSRGNVHDDLGNLEAAMEDFSRSIEIDPTLARAYNNRGLVYKKMEFYEKAISDFTKATMLEEGFAEAYNNSGVAKKHLRKFKSALLDFDQALRIDSSYSNAYYNRAAVKQMTKDKNGALEDYDKAIQFDETDAYAPAAKGCLLGSMGRRSDAILSLKAALKLNPDLDFAKDCLEDVLATE